MRTISELLESAAHWLAEPPTSNSDRYLVGELQKELRAAAQTPTAAPASSGAAEAAGLREGELAELATLLAARKLVIDAVRDAAEGHEGVYMSRGVVKALLRGWDALPALLAALRAPTPTATAATASGWVAVGESMPAPNTQAWAALLHHGTRHEIRTAFFRPDGIWDEFLHERITHWQPLYVAEPIAPPLPSAPTA
jgi:hypothetical protein